MVFFLVATRKRKRRKEGNSGPMFLRKGRRSTVQPSTCSLSTYQRNLMAPQCRLISFQCHQLIPLDIGSLHHYDLDSVSNTPSCDQDHDEEKVLVPLATERRSFHPMSHGSVASELIFFHDIGILCITVNQERKEKQN